MDIREISAAIRTSVNTIDVARALGLNVDRNGRCSCPFHNGRDRNMKIYEGTRGYYCFGCHKGGDCISLVTGVVPDCSYADAMSWINDQFNLGYRRENEKPTIWQRNRAGKIRQRKMNNGIQNPG
jgi:DNA primase